MISRLTASAAFFAVLATASLAYATDVQQHVLKAGSAKAESAEVIMLPGVVVTGKRVKR